MGIGSDVDPLAWSLLDAQLPPDLFHHEIVVNALGIFRREPLKSHGASSPARVGIAVQAGFPAALGTQPDQEVDSQRRGGEGEGRLEVLDVLSGGAVSGWPRFLGDEQASALAILRIRH